MRRQRSCFCCRGSPFSPGCTCDYADSVRGNPDDNPALPPVGPERDLGLHAGVAGVARAQAPRAVLSDGYLRAHVRLMIGALRGNYPAASLFEARRRSTALI